MGRQVQPASRPSDAARLSDVSAARVYSMQGHKSTLSEGFDLSGATDQADKLQSVLNSMTPGSVFWLTPNPAGGNSVLSVKKTVTPPAGVTIAGPEGAASIWGYSSGYPVQVSVMSGFVGTAVFKMDAGTGQINDFAFENFAIFGNHQGTSVHGIQAIGTVVNLQAEHMDIRSMSGNGVSCESNSTGTPKGWRLFRVMSESHDGWSFYIDGLTDSDILACHAHTSTLGGWYLAGLGDSRFTDLRATFVGGPGFMTADCSRSGRPWGSGVQLNNIGTDRSKGPGLYHTAHNLNPITIGTATFGRDQSNGGTVDDTLSAIKIDGGSGQQAGLLAFDQLTTTVGYDDTGQDDTYSSPGYAIDVANSRGFSVAGGVLWGKINQVKPMTDTVAGTVGPISIDPSVWMATGTRSGLTYLGNRGVALKLRTTSSSTVGVNTAGDRTFVVPQGLDFAYGMGVRAESQANPSTVYVDGTVSAYSGTTLSITPTTRVGSGSPSAWNIYASILTGGAAGAAGATGPAPTLALGNVTKIAAGGTPTAAVRSTGTGAYALDFGLVTGDAGAAGTTYTTTSTSATSNTVGTGSKTFALTGTGGTPGYAVGQFVRIVNTGTPANYMQGLVTAASSTSLTVNVTEMGGSGTLTAWTITVGGLTGVGMPTPVIKWTGTAWASTRAAAIPTGYTGPVRFDSSTDPTATAPPDITAQDSWEIAAVAGANGAVVYNKSGLPGGATGLFIDGGGFAWVPTGAPTTNPANGGVSLIAQKVAGRNLLATKDYKGRISTMQSSIAQKSVTWAVPNGAGGLSIMGTQITMVPSTGTNGTIAATNYFTAARRTSWDVTTMVATAIAGFYETVAKYILGTGTGGGLQFTARFGNSRGGSDTSKRMFVGLSSSVAAPTDVNPSTQTDVLGVGCDAADTNFQFMYRSGTGTVTKVDTGIAKPTTDATEVYEFSMTEEPNNYYIEFNLTRLSDGKLAYGDTSVPASGGGIPAQTTLLAARGYMSAGGISNVVGLALMNLVIESDI